MCKKVNVLIFPAGSESAMDIYDSLKYNVHFDVYGASGKSDHCEFIYPDGKLYIGSELYISNVDFIHDFNKVIKKFNIKYVIPTHDTIALYLSENREYIDATVIGSDYETSMVAQNKKIMYDVLKGHNYMPKIYQDSDHIDDYPVFLKPYIGAGGKGTYIIRNKGELNFVLSNNKNLLITEFLPGMEYTVDCFTDRKGRLLFFGPRTRERINMGISFHSVRAKNMEFENIAHSLNEKFSFRGAWFFQVKEDSHGKLKFMEFSVRQAGTMAFYRQLGVNFSALSLFDAMGYDAKVLFNDYELILDRKLEDNYFLNYEYKKLYIDFDDTLIVNGKVNTTLIKLIYQSINKGKKIVLLTKHIYDLDESLKKYKINKEIFNDIVLISPNSKKSDYIDKDKCIFIDNYFPERMSVKETCNIPVFDVDAVRCLLDSREI